MPSKKTTTTKTISDVAKPGKSTPTATSRPVIITNRPIMKDPMMVAEKDNDEEKVTVNVTSKSSIKPKLQPLTVPTEKEAETTETAEPKESEVNQAEPSPTAADTNDEKAKVAAEPADTKPAPKPAAEVGEPAGLPGADMREGDVIKDPAKQADDLERIETEKARAIQKLVDSKEFYLSINSLEKRRTKRVVAAGVVLSLVLVLAWVNLSLDAGLLEIPGVQPVTHFF